MLRRMHIELTESLTSSNPLLSIFKSGHQSAFSYRTGLLALFKNWA